MYITTNYLGIKKGSLDYLFYLLTEEYIEKSDTIQKELASLFNIFGRDLAGNGAIIKPSKGTESENLTRVLNLLPNDFVYGFGGKTPAILMLKEDLCSFNPKSSPYVVISLRHLINETGHVKIFELQEILTTLVELSRTHNTFHEIVNYLKKSGLSTLVDSSEIKPGFLGINLDIKKFFRKMSQKTFYEANIT